MSKHVFDALAYLKATYERLATNSLRGSLDGHWINEAFVVRLFAVLEAHHVVGNQPIDASLPGATRVDICRRLRNKIAHSTASVDDAARDPLFKRIRDEFGLGEQASLLDRKYILSKDTVLRPMYASCREYAAALLAKQQSA